MRHSRLARVTVLLSVPLGLLFAPTSRALAQARAAGHCVRCHQGLPEGSQAGHGFAAWRQSSHAVAGVQCEACHGGDATKPDSAAAHRGVVRSSNPASALYSTRLPATCGRCHAAEFGYFRSSRHFARLRSDGRGPNCVTCHGAMATSVPSAERVLGTCSACHVAGGVAPEDKARESAPVLSLVRSEAILYHVVSSVAGQSPAARAALARAPLASAQRNLAAAAEVWHTFRLDTASARLAAAQSDIVRAWTALGYSPPPPRTVARPVPPGGRRP